MTPGSMLVKTWLKGSSKYNGPESLEPAAAQENFSGH